MTPQEMLDECARYRDAGLKHITLVFPMCWRAPRGFPRGELLCVNQADERVYRLPIIKLERWLNAQEAAC